MSEVTTDSGYPDNASLERAQRVRVRATGTELRRAAGKLRHLEFQALSFRQPERPAHDVGIQLPFGRHVPGFLALDLDGKRQDAAQLPFQVGIAFFEYHKPLYVARQPANLRDRERVRSHVQMRRCKSPRSSAFSMK